MVQESDSDECEALYESNSDECETNYDPTVHVHPPPLPDTQHLFEGSTLTVKTSSVLIQQYKMRHGLTEEALADLLKLIKMHCAIPNKFPASVFHLKKNFPNIHYSYKLHHFCSKCVQSVEACATNCTNELCNTDFTESPDATSSFIEIPVESQLTTILESKF